MNYIIIFDNKEHDLGGFYMVQSKADVLLHPVRMKIIQALAGQSLTVQELLKEIKDVPQATMYRHLNLLKKHEIIFVQSEQKIRGVTERTYSLDPQKSFLSEEEAKSISNEEHLQYSIKYYTNVLRLMEDYLKEDINYNEDAFGYHLLELQLNDQEKQKFLEDYQQLIMKYQFERREDRSTVTMATAFIPKRKDS